MKFYIETSAENCRAIPKNATYLGLDALDHARKETIETLSAELVNPRVEAKCVDPSFEITEAQARVCGKLREENSFTVECEDGALNALLELEISIKRTPADDKIENVSFAWKLPSAEKFFEFWKSVSFTERMITKQDVADYLDAAQK